MRFFLLELAVGRRNGIRRDHFTIVSLFSFSPDSNRFKNRLEKQIGSQVARNKPEASGKLKFRDIASSCLTKLGQSHTLASSSG